MSASTTRQPGRTVLSIRALSKTYEPAPRWLAWATSTATTVPVVALSDATFDVAAGEIVGLVGPNGAGKTTLIKHVAGLLDPTRGSVTIDGYDVGADPLAVKRRLGLVLGDERGVYWRLDGRWNLEFFGVLAGLPRAVARERAGEALEQVGLAHRDRLTYGYSSGMRGALNIARALVPDPPLLVLDEPTRSLDPIAAIEVNTLLRRLADDGKAILLSSHRLDEVRAICDRVVVLVGGTVRYVGMEADLDGGLAERLRQEVSTP